MPGLYNITPYDRFLSLRLHLHNHQPQLYYSSSFDVIKSWDNFTIANSCGRIGHPFRQGRPHKFSLRLCCLENSLYNLLSCFDVIKHRKACLIIGSRETIGKLPTAYIVICPRIKYMFRLFINLQGQKISNKFVSTVALRFNNPWPRMAPPSHDVETSSYGKILQSCWQILISTPNVEACSSNLAAILITRMSSGGKKNRLVIHSKSTESGNTHVTVGQCCLEADSLER
jgi:hypothetical protein